MGSAELLLQGALVLSQTPRAERSEAIPLVQMQSKHAFPQIILLASLFAFIGALPWMVEKIASPRYPDQSQQFLKEKILSLSNAPTQDQISRFLSQPDSFVQIGRVAYPRFFGKNDGLSSAHPWPSYAIHDYPRIGFLLLNQHSISVVFPTKRISDFRHAADAIVLGCQREDYVEARLVAFPESDTLYFSEPFTKDCSP